MMTTLITVMTLILVLVIVLWALWPKLRAWIEQPKYDFLTHVRAHEDAAAHERNGSRDQAAGHDVK